MPDEQITSWDVAQAPADAVLARESDYFRVPRPFGATSSDTLAAHGFSFNILKSDPSELQGLSALNTGRRILAVQAPAEPQILPALPQGLIKRGRFLTHVGVPQVELDVVGAIELLRKKHFSRIIGE